MRSGLFIAGLWLAWGGTNLAQVTASGGVGMLPTPPFPLSAYENHEQGCVVVSVTFGSEGKTTGCKVLISSGWADIDRSTVAFIKAHWKNKALAGQTIKVPVNFVLPRDSPPQSLGDINPLEAGSPDRTVVLNVTFGNEGWVSDVGVAQSSGFERLDQETVAFVWSHWRSVPYAGRTMRVPIVYKPKPAKPPPNSGQTGG